MVARAFSETSGRVSSRTSPRAEDEAEALGAFADGKTSVRTAAGIGVACGELGGCAAGFFSAADFSELRVAAGGDGFDSGGVSRSAGCSTSFGGPAGWAEAVAEDGGDSGRWPRVFGSTRMATITKNPAATGTT